MVARLDSTHCSPLQAQSVPCLPKSPQRRYNTGVFRSQKSIPVYKMPTTTTANGRTGLPKGTLAISKAWPPTTPRLGVIARSEVKFLVFFTLFLCVVTTLPYVAGHFVSFPGTQFTDVLGHSLDTNNYLAYAHQAASGRLLFHNPMTAEPHGEVFFNIEWLVIGKLSSLLHVSLAFAMNIVRLLCLMLMCCGVYWLSSFLFCSTFIRRVALVASLTGGGFGWLRALRLLRIPIGSSCFLDLTNANLFPFYWVLKVPHFLASESFVVLGLCFFLSAESRHRARHYVAAGLCYMIAGTCRPYDMLFLMASTSVFLALWCWEHRELRQGIALRALPILMCVPLLGYYYWIFKIHPIFRWWSHYGNPAPMAWLLALGYGMTVLLLPFSVWRLRRGGLGQAGRFMLCCLLTAILFAHAHYLLHFSFQFATNILVPLVMIVLIGLETPIAEWKDNRRWAGASIIALLVVNSFTSIALTGQAILLAAQGDFRSDSHLLEAFSWLNAHSHTDDVIFADFEIANLIPQYTHDNVFCGYANAVHLDDKLRAIQQFLHPHTSNTFREQLLQQNAIQFVLLTATEERELAVLGEAPFLKEVFRNNATVIFSVRLQGRRSSLSSEPNRNRDRGAEVHFVEGAVASCGI